MGTVEGLFPGTFSVLPTKFTSIPSIFNSPSMSSSYYGTNEVLVIDCAWFGLKHRVEHPKCLFIGCRYPIK